jgi:hypothetical protein
VQYNPTIVQQNELSAREVTERAMYAAELADQYAAELPSSVTEQDAKDDQVIPIAVLNPDFCCITPLADCTAAQLNK